MLSLTIIILLFLNFKQIFAEFEPYIVGGSEVPIRKYPHSAFLMMSFQKDGTFLAVSCGGSILNQKIVLTAGHCLEDCTKASCSIIAKVGSADHTSASQIIDKFLVHADYNAYTVTYDIAMVSLRRPLKFGPLVKRVALVGNHPERVKVAEVAGWGLIDEENNIDAIRLKGVRQKLWSRQSCSQYVRLLPKTSICGGEVHSNTNYVAEGDSGSALIVEGYIQVGLVSYKQSSMSKSLVVYTDTAVMYTWIRAKARRLACA